MIVSLTQAMHFLYGLQKYDLKYGLSIHIKIKVVSKVSFTCKTPFFFLITNIKVIYFARFGDITKRDGISTYNLRYYVIKLEVVVYISNYGSFQK